MRDPRGSRGSMKCVETNSANPCQQLDLRSAWRSKQHTALGARLRAIESRYTVAKKCASNGNALWLHLYGKGRPSSQIQRLRQRSMPEITGFFTAVSRNLCLNLGEIRARTRSGIPFAAVMAAVRKVDRQADRQPDKRRSQFQRPKET